jgi:hypothetical protein
VKLLLERGADMHAMNGEGETPYQVSLRKEIERFQIYSGSMARADSEKGSTRSFCDLNMFSD